MVRASLEIGNSNQELMEKSNRKKWRMWLSAIVIFIVVLAIITAAVVLTRAKSGNDPEPLMRPISFEDVMQGKLIPNRFNATWFSDDELIYTNGDGNLVVYNVQTDTVKNLLTKDNQYLATSFDQQFSADKKYVLLVLNYRKLYRHSYTAQYVAVELETGQHQLITPTNDTYLELAVWAPQGNALAFVQNNNIYYRSSVTAPTVQISTDGIPGTIYNGVADWVYEEEIFGSNKALWFSEDGSHMAYGKFNDNLTRIMALSFYGHFEDLDSQYTRQLSVRYPKAGTANPTAEVVLVKLSEPLESTSLPVPDSLSEPLVASVTFATNSTVAITWTNRVQNESLVVLCDTTCRQIFQYAESNGWVDVLHAPIFISKGNSYFTILPEVLGNDSWRQIALISQPEINSNSWIKTYITKVPKTVTELLHWDEESQTLWYMGTSVKDSAYQHLYSVKKNGEINCFTCNITHSSGSQCLYNEASLSKSGSYIVVTCLGPQIPEVYIFSKNGVKVKNWERNEALAEYLSYKEIPVVRRFTVQIASDSMPPAQVLLMTPPNADLSGAVKYPMLVFVYGGPDSYQVLERWQLDWGASLVARWNIMLALIDGRGSGLKGNNNLFAIYRNLGTAEIDDQINVTRHLQKSLGYIDPERTCIWGWSYGGYAAALSLARGGDTFKCGISVAPVTDWLYYDSIYTERYMGIPSVVDNKDGYLAANLNTENIAAALSKKKFMLVHGTLDDNVHYQQSMMLSKMLQQNDVLFTQLSYPDEDHSLNGVKPHLYHSIEQFLDTNLRNHKDL